MKSSRFCGRSSATLLLMVTAACTKAEQTEQQNGTADSTLQMANVSADACSAGQVLLVASDINTSGTLELLAPIMDSGGYNEKVHDLTNGQCMSRRDLEELVRESGASVGETIAILATYDPQGVSRRYRPRFDFEADPGEPDVKPPMPPADMRFGEAAWSPAMKQLSVAWYPPTHEWFEQFAGSETSWSHTELAAIGKWNNLNSACRGGIGGSPKTDAACDERDGPATDRLRQLNICYGKDGQAGYEMEMHRCGPDSMRWN